MVWAPTLRRRGGQRGGSVARVTGAAEVGRRRPGTVTVPVGVPDPEATVAVNVTDWPDDGRARTRRAHQGGRWWPGACADRVGECGRGAGGEVGVAGVDGGDGVGADGQAVVVLRVAVPAVRVTGAPRLVPPSLNWTVPVAVPAPGAADGDGGGEGHGLADGRRVRSAVRVTVVEVARLVDRLGDGG